MSDDLMPCPGGRAIPLSLEDFLQRDRVALLLWDMQNGLAGKAPEIDAIRRNARRLVEEADRLSLPVIWSRHVLPPLELTAGPFLLFLMKKQGVDHPSKLKPTMQRGGSDTEFIDGLQPKPHHLVLEKSQPSLFVDTPLALRLRTMNVDTLVIAGVATDIGVEFNCRHGAALGFYTVVAEDASGAYTREAHERSLVYLRSSGTQVTTTETICGIWGQAG